MAATILLYIKTVKFDLVIDDVRHIRNVNRHRENRQMYAVLKEVLYGAGMFKSVALDHAFTIFLNCVLACLITHIAGLHVALAYISLPANNQILIWLNGRRYQLVIILGIIALLSLPAGIVLFPLALWIHVSALPILLLSLFVHGWAMLLMLVPGLFIIPRLKKWLKGRWAITPEPERKRFEPGKIIMAIKNLADYWVSLFYYPVFSMYHPKTWGIVEFPDQKQRAYGVNARFWASIGVLLAVHCLPIIWYGSWLKWALTADLCVVFWLGFWKNPVQYWAPRYGSWFYLIALIGLSNFIPSWAIYLFAAFNAGVVISNLEGYRDIPSYFWNQCVRDPNNMYAHWSAMQAFAEYSKTYAKKGRQIHALQYHTWCAAVGFYWCQR
ncbi:MAG: hypothetical protein EOL91_08505, partial [Actinobacteria bacterium]|nr:hypothetical protein [Actinomycetota bacterium]